MSGYNMKDKYEHFPNDFLPHITLETYDDLKKKRTGTPRSNLHSEPISEQDFKNKILDALSVGSVKSNSFDNSYFLMDLTNEYYSSSVTKMLKDLNLEIKTVLNDFQIIVRADPRSIYEYFEKKKEIPKKITDPINRIYCLNREERLGSNLLSLMRQDVENKKIFNISIWLLDNLSDEEECEFNKIINQHIHKDINPKYLPRSKQFICGSNTKRILEISELPFIKKISIVPKLKPQGYRSGELIHSKGSYEITKNADVPIICVIDSGTSEDSKCYCLLQEPYIFDDPFDSTDHGTRVASVACFGEDLINKKKKMEQKAKIISFKLEGGPGEEYMPLEEAVMTAVEEFKHLTKVFCLSYNYLDDIDPDARLDIVKELDRFVQKNQSCAGAPRCKEAVLQLLPVI